MPRIPSPRSSRILLATALCGAVAGVAEPARARSEFCGGALRVPNEPSIPGNLVAFDVLDPDLPYSLETLGGEPVAASAQRRSGKPVFQTDEPVAPGTQLRLRLTDCEIPRTYDFVAGPFAELDPITPTLVVAEREVEGAGTDAAISVVRLRYRGPDPENIAPHLVDVNASVDGRRLLPTRSNDGSLIELRSACNGSELQYGHSCALLSTPPGVYTVEVQTHIVGAEEDPALLALEVDTSCPSDEVAAGGVADAAGCALTPASEQRSPLLLFAAVGAALCYRRGR